MRQNLVCSFFSFPKTWQFSKGAICLSEHPSSFKHCTPEDEDQDYKSLLQLNSGDGCVQRLMAKSWKSSEQYTQF